MKLYLFLSFKLFSEIRIFPPREKKMQLPWVKFYTMHYPLEVEGRATPLFYFCHYMRKTNSLSCQVLNNVLHSPYIIIGRINS